MKMNTLKSLSVAFCLTLVSSMALAAPMVWTDTISYANNGVKLNNSNTSESYVHDVTNDGFQPGFNSIDSIDSFDLLISVADDNDSRTEWAKIKINGIRIDRAEIDYSPLEYSYTWDDGANSLAELSALFTLNAFGTLDVTIKRLSGDFFLKESTLTTYGVREDISDVPEPGALALLGLGLAGLGLARRKQKA